MADCDVTRAMNSRMIVVLIVLASLLCSCAPAPGSQLANAAAKDLIEKSLDGAHGKIHLRLGPLVVVSQLKALAEGRDPTDYEEGRLSQNKYQEYVAWARLDVISIKVDEEFEAYKSGKQFSWDRYMETISGTGSKIVATKTPKGDALMAEMLASQPAANQQVYAELSRKGHLFLSYGTFRVTKIVENTGYRGSGADWRLVLFLYDAAWEPAFEVWSSLMEQLFAKRMGDLTGKRKGRMLLKYDSFKSAWDTGTYDFASADAEFGTSSVPDAVRQNQLVPVPK